MSNDEKLIELLSAYLDDEVSEEEAHYVEKLLSTDEEAAALFARMSSTTNLFSQLDPVKPPVAFVKKVTSHISESSFNTFFDRIKRALLPRRIQVPALTYAAGVLVIGLILVVSFITITNISVVAPTASEQFVFEEGASDTTTGAAIDKTDTDKLPPEIEEDFVPDQFAGNSGETRDQSSPFLANEEPSQPEETLGADMERESEPSASSRTPSAAVRSFRASEDTARFPYYRAEILQVFSAEDLKEFIDGNGDDFVVMTSISGREINNLKEENKKGLTAADEDFAEPILQPIDFPMTYTAAGNDSIIIFGETIIDKDGLIVGYSIRGPKDSAQVIESFVNYYKKIHLSKFYSGGDPLPGRFGFIATLYPRDLRTD